MITQTTINNTLGVLSIFGIVSILTWPGRCSQREETQKIALKIHLALEAGDFDKAAVETENLLNVVGPHDNDDPNRPELGYR